ncbi:MAG: lysophospholipid acyltransferase family protein [Raineya sp.]
MATFHHFAEAYVLVQERYKQADFKTLKKVLAWLLTTILMLLFALTLIVFHPFHVLFSFFGYRAYIFVSHTMMWVVWKSTYLIGTKTRLQGLEHLKKLPKDRPVIVVSNHQSEYEIACLGVLFSKTSHHLKYIAKKELSYWIPSVSWNIRYGGHGTISRNHRELALKAIEKFAENIKKNNWAAYIYPEGTRNKNGNEMRPFKTAGFVKLCECLPDALIIPISLENFWTVKRIPIIPFAQMRVRIFEPISQEKFENSEQLLKHCEKLIRQDLGLAT